MYVSFPLSYLLYLLLWMLTAAVAAVDQASYGMAEEAVRLVEESLKEGVKAKL